MAYTRALVVAAGALAMAVAAVPVRGEELSWEDYLHEDVHISGREMHAFAVDAEPVAIVLGDFVLTVGGRRLSGRDAVIWIRETRTGERVLRRIVAYVEGPVEIVEPGGAVTRDRAMLVTLHHTGSLRAEVGVHLDLPVANLPVYKRGVAMRGSVSGPSSRPAVETPRAVEVVTPPAPRAERPAGRAQPSRVGPTDEPGAPAIVGYRADETVSEVRRIEGEPGEPRRVTICKGNVYLSHGRADDQETFLEMRADAAVLFSSAKLAPAKGDAAGGGLQVKGLEGVEVDGVYLQGDVVASWGERTMRGHRLYFDFRNNRAIILDAVVRVIQEQRNIPIYVRAAEARFQIRRFEDQKIGLHQVWFRNAKISSSEFKTPTYHIGAVRGTLRDTTPYDAVGEPLAERNFRVRLWHTTLNVHGIPVWYWPWSGVDGETPDSPLKRIQVGDHGRFGLGMESQWHLFRLLGLVRPDGFKGTFKVETYEKGTSLGADVKYARENYTGLLKTYGVRDREREDDFGRDRKNIPAPAERGRVLWRHKQFLQQDWQVQTELSYLCDRNFLEQFFRDEFYGGKEQESLLYVKKQQDNWAVTALLQGRLNDFQTTTEAMPDVGLHLVGEPLAGGWLNLFSESRIGAIRVRPDEDDATLFASDWMGRAKTRAEVTAPLRLGPVNVVPYVLGLARHWNEAFRENDVTWVTGGGGVRANLHIWRVYDDVRSRLLDIHRLRHVVTPEVTAVALVSDGQAFYPGTELKSGPEEFQAVKVGVRQRWQTYRGPEDGRHVAELARLNVWGLFFNGTRPPTRPADGRLFFDRPEESLTRNAVNGDLAVNISDATAVLGDMNYDLNDREIGLANFGLAVQREPRLRYYAGLRYAEDLESFVGTLGLYYQINPKYQFSAFQQYDLEFNGGENLVTEISVLRKFPRWYMGVSLVIDRAADDVGVLLTLWPQGVPEFRIGGPRVGTWAASDLN